MQEERSFWLIWSQIDGVGPVLLRRLQEHFGSLIDAWEASPQELGQVDGIGIQLLERITAQRSRLNLDQFIQEHDRNNPEFWTPADPDYPRLLLEIPNPPPVLYYRGRVDLQENQGIMPTLAIVGTRDPSDYGKRWTRKVATALAHKGFTIVSGLAEGIDTEAHRACLDAGGRTIAALGTGVDLVYPARNRTLYGELLEQGIAVSEYPAGTQPDRAHFPRRNRIIAGLSRATLVMEAPSKSGALITAHIANDFGRDVYVLPGSLDNEKAIGCLGLLSKGAQAILNEGHLLEMLGAIPPIDQPISKPTPIPNLPADLAAVLKGVSIDPRPFDVIVQQVGLEPGIISGALLQLELMGLVTQLPGMRYQR